MRFALALLCLVALLVVAGCATNDKNSDDDKFTGFYGGINGGVAP